MQIFLINPKDNLIQFQNDWNRNVGEDRFLNPKTVHFWEIAIKVWTRTVITCTFMISKCNNFG